MARWLDVTPVTVTRWKTGYSPIPGPAALAIQALASGWRPTHPKIGDEHEHD